MDGKKVTHIIHDTGNSEYHYVYKDQTVEDYILGMIVNFDLTDPDEIKYFGEELQIFEVSKSFMPAITSSKIKIKLVKLK